MIELGGTRSPPSASEEPRTWPRRGAEAEALVTGFPETKRLRSNRLTRALHRNQFGSPLFPESGQTADVSGCPAWCQKPRLQMRPPTETAFCNGPGDVKSPRVMSRRRAHASVRGRRRGRHTMLSEGTVSLSRYAWFVG